MELEKGKVTMVIPLYNKVNAIRTTLESVVNYHGTVPFECIIVDDNSNDGSSEIAKEFECKYPELFTYVKIQHRGIYGPANARNFGIRLCNSEYICFLDADDELYEGHINRSVEFLNKYKYINIYGENYCYNESVDTMYVFPYDWKINTIEDIFKYNMGAGIGFWAFMFKTEQVKEVMFEDCTGEDGVFLFTMLHRYKPFYYNIQQIALIYNILNCKTGKIHNNIDGGNTLYNYMIKTNELNPDFPIKIHNEDNNWYLTDVNHNELVKE